MHKFSKTMKIIRSILLLAVGFGTLPAQAQLTIDACQQKAQANYPLVAQYGLIRQVTSGWKPGELAPAQ